MPATRRAASFSSLEALTPLGLTGSPLAYNSKDAGDEFVGVLKASILVSDPRAAIVTSGQINAAASPYPVTDTIKNGLPRIEFLY